jgi:hypothetical protein
MNMCLLRQWYGLNLYQGEVQNWEVMEQTVARGHAAGRMRFISLAMIRERKQKQEKGRKKHKHEVGDYIPGPEDTVQEG